MRFLCCVALVLCLLFLFSTSTSYGQLANYLPYHAEDSSRNYIAALSHRQSMEKAFVLPAGVSKDYKKAYLSMVENFSVSIYSTIRHRALLDTLIDPYVQGIFQQVVAANPDLPFARLVVVRNPIENAYALGDGTILFNMGLLSKLENESQIAFVICHELAHIYFRHMQEGLKEHFDIFYNKDFRKQYKKIIKEEYNMYAKVNSLVQSVSLNKLYHNRTHEQQADSMGWVLLSKSGYDVNQAYTALQLLDKIEEPYSNESIDFRRHFGCAETNELLREKPQKTTSIFAVEPEKPKAFELSDTLKTHPNCEKRMQFLLTMGQKNPSLKEIMPENIGEFNYIKRVSRIEVIQSWYDATHYDRALFETLLLLQKDSRNSYLHSMVMLCLYELKDHLQKHRYADVVSMVSDFQPEIFNEYLLQLHNLNLSNFTHLGSCFSQLYVPEDTTDEYGLAAAYAFRSLMNEQEAADQIKEKYLKKYKQGILRRSLFGENN